MVWRVYAGVLTSRTALQTLPGKSCGARATLSMSYISGYERLSVSSQALIHIVLCIVSR